MLPNPWIEKYRPILIVLLPSLAIVLMELGLSAANIYKYKSNIKPYHVTPLLRPVLRKLVQDDFIPRTHQMQGVPWDYQTDRMRPGTYQTDGQPDYTVNSYGIRGKEFQIPKPKGLYRIVIFGGSSTLGAESRDDRTFPADLERALNHKIKNKKFEVLNYGIGSKSLYYNARKYFLEVDQLDPDMIILNNIRNTWMYDQNQEICNYNDINLPEENVKIRTIQFLTDHSLIYRLFYKRQQKKLSLSYLQRGHDSGVSFNRVFFDQLYYKVIRSIYEDTRRRGIRFVLSKEPLHIDPEKQRLYKKMTNDELYRLFEVPSLQPKDSDLVCTALLYNNIERLKKDAGDLIVVDPVEYFLKAEGEEAGISLFVDNFHLTEKGNSFFADFIVGQISGAIQ